jgi:glycosyltransferase involved in cell wall biosynthesis
MNPLILNEPSAGNSDVVLPLPPVARTCEPASGRTPAGAGCVFHLINGQHYSGAERVQDLLAVSLPTLGYEVAFGCLKPDRFPAQRRSQQARLVEVAMHHRFDWTVLKRTIRAARDLGCCLVHAHTPRTLVVGWWVARRLGIPLVYHVHSPVGRDSTRRWGNRLNQAAETWAARRAAALICVSSSLASYMRGLGHDPRRIHVVHNGVAVANQPSSRRRTAHEPLVIGTIALFRPRKGLEVLLEALSQLRAKGQTVRLLAVGPFETTEYEQHIKSLAAGLGIDGLITWTGYERDVDARLAEMDVFVLPSLFGEGLPMVVLEAMATGRAIAAASVEGIPEAITDGVEGVLFPPGDAAALAQRIAWLLDGDRAHRLGQAARVRQAAEFSEVSMACGVARVYDAVLETARRNV